MTKIILFGEHIPTIMLNLIQDLNLSTNKDEIRFNKKLISELEKISININCTNDMGLNLISISNDLFAMHENKYLTKYYGSYIKSIENDIVERGVCTFIIKEYDETVPHILKNESITELKKLDTKHNILTHSNYISEDILSIYKE